MSRTIPINAQTETKRVARHNTFSKVPASEQFLLSILAIVYKPIDLNAYEAILDLLKKDGLLNEPLDEYSLLPDRLEKLLFKGLLQEQGRLLYVNRLLCNTLTYAMSTEYLVRILKAAEKIVPVGNAHHWQPKSINGQRVIRDIYFTQQFAQLSACFTFDKNPQIIDLAQNAPLIELCFLPFNLSRFLRLPTVIQYQAFAALLLQAQTTGQSIDFPVSLLEQVCEAHQTSNQQGLETDNIKPEQHSLNLSLLLAEHYLLQMRFDDYRALQSQFDQSAYALQLQGAYQFIIGNHEQSIEYFEQGQKAKNKYARRKYQYLGEVLGYFYKLALVAASQDNAHHLDMAMQQIEFEQSDTKRTSDYYGLGRYFLNPLRSLISGQPLAVNMAFSNVDVSRYFLCHQLINLTHVFATHWCAANETDKAQLSWLSDLTAQCISSLRENGYLLFAHFCEQASKDISASKVDDDLLAHRAAELGETNAIETSTIEKSTAEPSTSQNNVAIVQVHALVKAKSQWDLALDKLIALNPNLKPTPAVQDTDSQPNTRLVWDLNIGYEYTLRPREQKRNGDRWSKGRAVSLKRLREARQSFPYLSVSDHQLCDAIKGTQTFGYYPKIEYELTGLSALSAAIGADNIFVDGDYGYPIELLKKEPSLLVNQQGNELCLSMADLSSITLVSGDQERYSARNFSSESAIPTQASFSFVQVNPSQYQLTIFEPEHLRVAQIIGEGGLLIPLSAKQKALESIAAIAPLLDIQSNIEELDTGLATQACDPRLFINIHPTKEGLVFTCVVMPFGEQGPAFKPGIGNASLSAEIRSTDTNNTKRVATVRDLQNEEALLDCLDEACPAFLSMHDNVLSINDFHEALHVLEGLETAQRNKTVELALRWPKGQKISVSNTLKTEHLQLAVSKKNEWFDLSGELDLGDMIIDDSKVLGFRKLLELVKSTQGRFINLGNEQILALSEDLRQKLEILGQVSDQGEFHPLASLQVEEATQGMRMKTIHAWEQQTIKMHEANDIDIDVPSTLQAELRDYQVVGFDWASRLAHWGAGACLADDMGLGKTLQGLALLLARASDGPSLVIAPTSVCFNWQQEAHKFAPTLNVKLFADATTSEQRDALLADVSAFDCVVISYGLLQRQSDKLQSVKWNSIIADEAQALKNPVAKRTKAACALKAEFKMLMTGTPIENDLTELWSLFRFSNPGLLGNLKRFTQRFIAPIENAKEDKLAARKASQALKALIQPFILRRMKHQVLTELPSRTEININVELDKDQRAFYEALRLNALDNIVEASQHSSQGEQKIRMLAEMIKLRQACCHAKLVMPDSDIQSAKLAALQSLLTDLKENKHKALIFSQFVGHLHLIKEHVEKMGLRLQYLDGSTPQKERQRRVNAFQAGEGDVFLISLKAGGSGLNLTAADYVIHMDPWWNPAVEEQASDRAHRIGQTRPVTIYRLIAKNTIEEKIVALHQRKRDLADKLLAGNDVASTLSVDDMLNMLKETF